jgi:sarcosine oxidase subunit beta
MASRAVVVIGGGITGTLTARALAGAGWQVTLLEAAHLGAGSSSRTAAGIRQQFSTPASVRGMRHAVRFYREWGESLGESPIRQSGYLFLSGHDADPDAGPARVRLQQENGLAEVSWLSAAETVARFPWVDVDQISGASWCPTDGFLYPSLVYMEAAREARERGATIVQGAPVERADHVGGRLVRVHTPKGAFEADLFIDATNAWSPRLANVLGALALDIAPIKRFLWFLPRGGPMDAETLAAMPLVVGPRGGYCRPENAGSLLMGFAHQTASEPAFTYEDQDLVPPEFSHRGGLDALPFEVWLQLAEVIPALGEFDGIHATTAGFYAVTPDHNPFLGFDPQVPNLIRLAGFSGHGAMFGPVSAAVAVALADAGRDVPAIDTPEGRVELASFAIGRAYAHAESLVI